MYALQKGLAGITTFCGQHCRHMWPRAGDPIIIDNSPDKRILNDRHVSHLSQYPLNSSPMLHRVAHNYDRKVAAEVVAQYMPDLCCYIVCHSCAW